MSTEISLRLGREPLRLCLDALPETARETGHRGRQVLRRACCPVPGLLITAEIFLWPEHSVRETLVCLTNTGVSPTEILSDFRLEETLPAANAALRHGNGDTCRTDGYHWQETPLTEEITLSPADGTSCNGAFPYFRLETPAGGYNLAVGWPARWQATFRPGEAAVSLALSQKRCHTRLLPGETFRLPRLTVQQYEGTPRAGANAWRRWYLSCLMPLDYGKPMSPKYCLHNWFSEGMPEFTGATEENQIRALNRYVAHGLKPDIWWVDAGWYPCHGDWTHTGTWTWDKSRFPRGLAPLGQACAQAGAQLLLWFEPERVRPQTCLAENHPQWLLHARKDDGTEMENMLLNLGDPACLQALIAHINALIQESGVKIYRQDFNFDPAPYWDQNEAPDRVGMLENLHVQGYLAYWDALRRENPGLWVDSCASGGRRNDLETMRRAVPLHYTDMGYGNHPLKQLQHRQMFDWIPYFRAHNMNWDLPDGSYSTENHDPDDFAFHCALAPALTDMTHYTASDEAFALSRKWLPVWRAAANLMLTADYYPLTECRASAEDFYAMQFHRPDTDSGFFQVVSNVKNAEPRFTACLQALSPEASYRLTEAFTGEETLLSGAALSQGFHLACAPRTGRIWFYEKI